MALGILMIGFVVMSVISILGLLLMFLVKNRKTTEKVLYFMAGWGMIIAVLGASAQPSNYVIQQLVSWILGFLGIAGVLVYKKAGNRWMTLIAYLLIILSVVGGMERLFF